MFNAARPPFHGEIITQFFGAKFLTGGRENQMKKAMEIRVGDRVFDRGVSFKVKEIFTDAHRHRWFRDALGHLHGPYVPNEFIGVKREGLERNQFEILSQFATPTEQEDEKQIYLHDDGLCNPDR